jgi:hypothetical protein
MQGEDAALLPDNTISNGLRTIWVQWFGTAVRGSEASSTATATDSRLLFLAEFLESGIGAQRVPDRIEA